MSIITLAYPAQIAITLAETISVFVAFVVRSAFGLAIFTILATLVFVFKPLLIGIVRATQLVLHPRISAQQRHLLSKLKGARQMYRLANDVEANQPNLAAEIRFIAARD